MAKYTDEVKKVCVEKAKQGVALAEICRQHGPNPKAIERYCKAAGVELPKKVRAPKATKEVAPKAAPAPAKKQ